MPCAFYVERPVPFQDLALGCQFHIEEEQLTQVDGESWCVFHMPMQTQDRCYTEKSRWNEQQKSYFNKSIFEWIKQAETEEKVCDLTGVVFPGPINFSRKEPYPGVCFVKAQFSSHVDFQQVHFSNHASFHEAQFFGNARFNEVQFCRDAWFRKAQFTGNASFSKVQFHGRANFSSEWGSGIPEANWFHDINFEDATFHYQAVFNNRQF